jgi:hypothetical protein
MAAVDECERCDLALERRREGAHLPDPLVLKRMMLRLDEDMKAEDGLEQRRVRVRDALQWLGRVGESGWPPIFFLAKELTR